MGIKLFQLLEDEGFSPNAIAGIVANVKHESDFDPRAVGDNGNAVGLFQWNGPRAEAFLDYTEKNKLNPYDPAVQVRYMQVELSDNPKLLKALNEAKSPEEAAAIFTRQFERPADTEGQAKARAATAREAFDYMKTRKAPIKEDGTAETPKTAQGADIGQPQIVKDIENAIAPITEPLGRGIEDTARSIESGALWLGKKLGLVSEEDRQDAEAARQAQEDEWRARGGEESSALRTAGQGLGWMAVPVPGAGMAARGVMAGVKYGVPAAARVATSDLGGAAMGALSGLTGDPITGALVGGAGARGARAVVEGIKAARAGSKFDKLSPLAQMLVGKHQALRPGSPEAKALAEELVNAARNIKP